MLSVHSLARADDPPIAPSAETPVILLHLAEASAEEALALNRLASARSWTSRALACMRLERYDCVASAGRLTSFTGDSSWRVRAYAYACLARRGILVPTETIEAERDPRVLRAILRGRYEVAQSSIDTRIASIEKSLNLYEATVALEILAAAQFGGAHTPPDPLVVERMTELLKRIILRMNRAEGGSLSSRLAAITSGNDSARSYRWQEWYRKSRKDPGYEPSALVPSRPSGARLVERNRVADLSTPQFVAFETYLAAIAIRPMDLAILIDCTASMSREISDAQANIDELVDFLGSVTGGLRLGIVGYRDDSDGWETKAWDFTTSLDEARERLWNLSAEGGGDTPESVYAAMKLALTKLSWLKDPLPPAEPPIRACVIVGDAPPHVGEGKLCVDLAKRGFASGVRFYGIIARDAESNLKSEDQGDDQGDDQGEDQGDVLVPSKRAPAPDSVTPDEPRKDAKNPTGKQIAPPRAPKPSSVKEHSYTWFPEISEAGGGRAEILKSQDSLVAEIAELTIADKYRAEFADFFAAFRVLCR